MGMYTELYLTCGLKEDLPAEVVDVLKYLFTSGGQEPTNLPAHEFFSSDRWSLIGRCASYYFVPFAASNLYFDQGISNQYYLTTRSDLKNYGGEIQKFLDWLAPYIEAGENDHLGHYRYEEDETPTLIFMKDIKK